MFEILYVFTFSTTYNFSAFAKFGLIIGFGVVYISYDLWVF